VRGLQETIRADSGFFSSSRMAHGDSAMTSDRKKPGVAFCATVVVVVVTGCCKTTAFPTQLIKSRAGHGEPRQGIMPQ
jgi:hypothetical protein